MSNANLLFGQALMGIGERIGNTMQRRAEEERAREWQQALLKEQRDREDAVHRRQRQETLDDEERRKAAAHIDLLIKEGLLARGEESNPVAVAAASDKYAIRQAEIAADEDEQRKYTKWDRANKERERNRTEAARKQAEQEWTALSDEIVTMEQELDSIQKEEADEIERLQNTLTGQGLTLQDRQGIDAIAEQMALGAGNTAPPAAYEAAALKEYLGRKMQSAMLTSKVSPRLGQVQILRERINAARQRANALEGSFGGFVGKKHVRTEDEYPIEIAPLDRPVVNLPAGPAAPKQVNVTTPYSDAEMLSVRPQSAGVPVAAPDNADAEAKMLAYVNELSSKPPAPAAVAAPSPRTASPYPVGVSGPGPITPHPEQSAAVDEAVIDAFIFQPKHYAPRTQDDIDAEIAGRNAALLRLNDAMTPNYVQKTPAQIAREQRTPVPPPAWLAPFQPEHYAPRTQDDIDAEIAERNAALAQLNADMTPSYIRKTPAQVAREQADRRKTPVLLDPFLFKSEHYRR